MAADIEKENVINRTFFKKRRKSVFRVAGALKCLNCYSLRTDLQILILPNSLPPSSEDYA